MFNFEFFFIGIILNLFSVKLISPLLKKYFLTQPVKISSHKRPTPSGAGILFVISTLIITVFNVLFNGLSFFSNIIIFSTILSVVGLIDDYFCLSRLLRFIIQNFVVVLIVLVSPFSGSNILLFLFICFIGVSIINLINFTDGIDGLLAGTMLVFLIGAELYLSISPYLFSLSAGLLIFLFFNWHPSKFFMGDAGSLFLGTIFFGIILSTNNFEEMLRIFLLGTPLFADAILCILKRSILNENIFLGHKKHLYQRLVRGGMSHSKVSSLYIISTFLLSIINYFFNIYILLISSFLVICFGFYINKYAVKFSAIEK